MVKKTSQQWQEENMKTIVIDPDGWDRTNYKYSWFEEQITREEYSSRLEKSTVMLNRDYGGNYQTRTYRL